MFEATSMLFLCAETPLHAGSGRGLGAIDLPIQRERITDYPMIQASGVKGRLRAEARRQGLADLGAIFGPETTENPSEHAGALAVGDARLLLFPVRSLAGVFAWTTSVDVLARFRREAALAGLALPDDRLAAPDEGATLVTSTSDVVAGESVVLEEFSFTPDRGQAGALDALAAWLAATALPQGPEYDYWRAALPRKLVVLPENAFRDFTRYGTEIQTHVRLNDETKTVASGALWTVESLPVDTLLYAPLLATPSRERRVNGSAPNGSGADRGSAGQAATQSSDAAVKLNGTQVLEKLGEIGITRLQLGGDETTGQGIVATRMAKIAGSQKGGSA